MWINQKQKQGGNIFSLFLLIDILSSYFEIWNTFWILFGKRTISVVDWIIQVVKIVMHYVEWNSSEFKFELKDED